MQYSKHMIRKAFLCLLAAIMLTACGASGAAGTAAVESAESAAAEAPQESYSYEEYPLERNGISLHLDCVKAENTDPEKNVLMMHGSTYSSHEFDIDYEDYSLVRRLAREGYAVWRLDIAGYGQSEEVEDGLMPDTAYAAEDIRAAMELIADETGQERIDLLGWSWGTMTTGLFAGEDPED